MANIEKLKFAALKVIGANYIACTIDADLHLESEKLSDTIKEKNSSTQQNKSKAIIFLRKHLDENLMHDYAYIKDLTDLWTTLRERFDNQRAITLSHALDEWTHLRFQDFEKVEHYNSAMLRIVAQLAYCGKPVSEAKMLNKTDLTFHKTHYVLQEQYKNYGYKRFSEFIVALMIAKKNNDFLIKNRNARPTGIVAILEVNTTNIRNSERGGQTSRGHGGRFNRRRGRRYNPQDRKPFKWVRSEKNLKGKETQVNPAQKCDGICYRCGSNGHWSRLCRTPKHLCKLYQESTKGKGKEVNFTEHFEGTMHIDGSCFMNDFDETAFANN